ncbi:MAG: LPS export ABC transporter periplasmic protein LptC [Bacteroidales bacterium]|nr:LPS export ABC transporter periplasmic protein LptC [Bacteroidales bacterium]
MMKRIFYFFLPGLFFSACSQQVDTLNSYNVDETFADLSVTDLKTSYYSGHSLQSQITAPIVDDYETTEQPYMEFPKGVKVVFYDEQLREESVLTADYAVYYSKKKLWEARKNVVVKNDQGAKLLTEQLFGDEVHRKIFAVKKVTVIDPDSTVIVGKQGFESDMTFRNYKFLDVNGVVNLNNQYGETIQGDSLKNQNIE